MRRRGSRPRLLAGRFVAAVAAAAALAVPATHAADSFVDRAAESGLDFVHFNGMSGSLYFPEMMGAGGAFLDYDRDGDLDVYLVQGHMLGPGREVEDATFPPEHPLPLSDRLYRNDLERTPDGGLRARFTDVTETSGLAGLATGYGMGVAVGDYDGDGWPDLYLANFGRNQMLRNRGDGGFEDTTEATGTGDTRWSVAASFLDYDGDGRLDLYVVNYVAFDFAVEKRCTAESGAPDYCSPLAYDPVPDRLFRNRGPGGPRTAFEDVSVRTGIAGTAASGLGVVAGDFDGDGRGDFYVTNDGMPNFLWTQGADGTFEDMALLAGSAVNRMGKAEAGMGVDAGDVDGDGDEDLFMAHLTGETNTLYRSEGGGLFLDQSLQSSLGPPSLPYTGFGTGFFDYDNDGRLDVLVVNGAVTRIEAQVRERHPHPLHQRNLLFRNLPAREGGFRFEDVSAAAGEALALSEVSRGAAFGDVEGDGDTDVLVTNNAGPARLLVNRVGQDRPSVGVRALAASGADALGARVVLRAPGRPPAGRRIKTDGSYASAHDPRVLVGLGSAEAPPAGALEVEVHWPAGGVERWRGLSADRYLVVYREGEATR